jgi:hypothetical protein
MRTSAQIRIRSLTWPIDLRRLAVCDAFEPQLPLNFRARAALFMPKLSLNFRPDRWVSQGVRDRPGCR